MNTLSHPITADGPTANQPNASPAIATPSIPNGLRRHLPLLGEAARYLVASAAALAVDMLTLSALVEWGGLHYLPAATLGYLVGTFVAFFISVRWVFKHRAFNSLFTGLGVFALIGLLGLGVNLLVMWGAANALHAPYLLAKVLAAGTSVLVNFSVRRAALFMQRRRPSSAP